MDRNSEMQAGMRKGLQRDWEVEGTQRLTCSRLQLSPREASCSGGIFSRFQYPGPGKESEAVRVARLEGFRAELATSPGFLFQRPNPPPLPP